MYRVYLFLLALVLGCVAVAAAEDGDGGYGGAFLQVPIGARPSAMGGAYMAVSDDGAGLLFNPAGASGIRKTLFSSSYRLMDLDRSLSFVALAIPTAKLSTLAFSWRYAGSGSVEARNTDGDKLGFELSQHNHQFTFLFAKRFENFFSAGLRGSYFHSQFAEMTAFSVSLDVGVMFYISNLFKRDKREKMSIQDIKAGIVLRNLGAEYRWNNEKYLVKYATGVLPTEQDDQIPLEVAVGGSARFFKRKLLLAADMLGDKESRFAFHGGAEYSISPQLALRGGFSDGRVTAGTGYIFQFTSWVLAIDYAFSSDKADAGSEHIFSFDVTF